MLKICLPFLVEEDAMIFSIASSIGTRPTNNKNVVYDVGGQAIQSSKPESIDNRMFFFMCLCKLRLCSFKYFIARSVATWQSYRTFGYAEIATLSLAMTWRSAFVLRRFFVLILFFVIVLPFLFINLNRHCACYTHYKFTFYRMGFVVGFNFGNGTAYAFFKHFG